MHEICQKYAGNMQIYAKNMQVLSIICKKYANMWTVLVEYAKNM